jgi:hypothetical protein
MRGPYYLIETLRRESHTEDTIRLEQDERKLKWMRTMGSFALGMTSFMGAYIVSDAYEMDRGLLDAATENNSIGLSVLIGTKIVADALVATIIAGTVAEFGSLTHQAHCRLREVRSPQFDSFVER